MTVNASGGGKPFCIREGPRYLKSSISLTAKEEKASAVLKTKRLSFYLLFTLTLLVQF